MIKSLCQAMLHHAETRGDRLALRFLVSGDVDGPRVELSFAEFCDKALAIAAALQRCTRPGERALLLYPDGVDYLLALYGCFFAGVIAVPTYPPDPGRVHRTLPRLQTIGNNARATLVLTTSELHAAADPLHAKATSLRELTWLPTDALTTRAADWVRHEERPEDVAYLQYTSGSTGDPKGVIITKENLRLTCGDWLARWPYDDEGHQVTWLPPAHDGGLVWGLLTPLFAGTPCTFLSPLAFVQRPARWLEAISRFRATTTVAPDFGFALCVQKVTDEEFRRLDLSCLRAAGNAAEPVRPRTLDAFQRRFEPAGFPRWGLRPMWGLAETTLQVTVSNPVDGPPTLLSISAAELEQGRVVRVEPDAPGVYLAVGCGTPAAIHQVAIVDPATLQRSPAGHVGEIWVSGPTVAHGYWERPEETAKIFYRWEGDRVWLRTGDLGFVHEGEVFVCGRLKDVIIVRGRNLYPQDIEQIAELADPAVHPGCVAAFPLDIEGEERVGLVAEVLPVEPPRPHEETIAAIRAAVADAVDVQLHDIALVPPRALYKTSSGKVQRRRTRDALARGELRVLARWVGPVTHETTAAQQPAPHQRLSVPEIEALLWATLRGMSRLPLPPTPARDTPFRDLGMDSVSVAEASRRLEALFGRPLPPTLLYEHPTLASLATHLAASSSGPQAPTASRKVAAQEPVAIIGMGCRFPGAEGGLESLWGLLRDGRDAISDVPPERWDVDAFYDARTDAPGKMCTRRGGFLREIDRFDAAFFGISPREAATMDPQQRLLLEVAWETLEDAAILPSQIAGTLTGVFVGHLNNDFSTLLREAPSRAGTGVAPCIAANRLSYFFDLRGPSYTVDTACSASLVAIAQACDSLLSGAADLAFAGGVNALLSPQTTVSASQAGMLAPDGRCKTFDERADGYVRSEGCGLVLLKRLSDALRDGDRIHAVIRGIATNSNGRSNGLTAPSGPAQQQVIRRALERASVAPEEVECIEAHGTGTPLGDLIEIEALRAVYGAPRPEGRWCAVGSVKTNLGHLESAAGIAGVAKAILSLERETTLPHLNLEKQSQKLPLQGTPFRIPVEASPWPRGKRPRFAAVSSFGFGGTNAHVILEEAPAPASQPAPVPERLLHPLVLSARSDAALRSLAARLAGHLAVHPEASLADVCYTANAGRAAFPHRLATTVRTLAELRSKLQAFARGDTEPSVYTGQGGARPPAVVFAFAGEGSPHAQTSRTLYETQPVFRRAIDRCAEILRPHLQEPLTSALYPTQGAGPLLDEPRYAQPAVFAVQYALAALWGSFGVRPDAVIGRGLGEFAAACVAGAIELEGALRLVAVRARSVDELAAALGGAHRQAPTMPYLSPLTGQPLAEGQVLDPSRWCHSPPHAAFEAAIEGLLTRGDRCVIEIGLEEAKGATTGAASGAASRLPSLQPGGDDWEIMLDSLARLFVQGSNPDWRGVDHGYPRRVVSLPTYPFERRRHWPSPAELRTFSPPEGSEG